MKKCFGLLFWLLFTTICCLGEVHATCTVGNGVEVGQERVKANDEHNFYDECSTAIANHVKIELEAALQYLLMGAYFEQDNVALPGFAKLFFEHADEERQHGLKFIDYLRMRGGKNDQKFFEYLFPILSKDTWEDGEDALRDALLMEKKVSGAIKELIDTCDNDNIKDYQAADWLTSTWLEEQLQGQRKLAGLINTLNSFRKGHEDLADWLFSNHLMRE